MCSCFMIVCLPPFNFPFLALVFFYPTASLYLSPCLRFFFTFSIHSISLLIPSSRTNLRPKSNKIFYVFILVSKYFVTKMISKGLDIALQLLYYTQYIHSHENTFMRLLWSLFSNWIESIKWIVCHIVHWCFCFCYISCSCYHYTYYERKQNCYALFFVNTHAISNKTTSILCD